MWKLKYRWSGWLLLLMFVRALAAPPTPLPVDQAFPLKVWSPDPQTIVVEWNIQPGYYLYKDRIHITPAVEVRSRRIGGATFQIPSEVRPDRKISLSIKWLIRYSRDRNGRSMAEKLAGEIVAASKGEGGAFKKKEDTHRMAEANKAFAHFRI